MSLRVMDAGGATIAASLGMPDEFVGDFLDSGDLLVTGLDVVLVFDRRKDDSSAATELSEWWQSRLGSLRYVRQTSGSTDNLKMCSSFAADLPRSFPKSFELPVFVAGGGL